MRRAELPASVFGVAIGEPLEAVKSRFRTEPAWGRDDDDPADSLMVVVRDPLATRVFVKSLDGVIFQITARLDDDSAAGNDAIRQALTDRYGEGKTSLWLASKNGRDVEIRFNRLLSTIEYTDVAIQAERRQRLDAAKAAVVQGKL